MVPAERKEKCNNQGISDIVKTIVDHGGVTHIVQRNNTFEYILDETMGDETVSKSKRQKHSQLSDSASSNSTIPSASDWSFDQRSLFKLKFISETSEVAFKEFFGTECPKEVPESMKRLNDLDWSFEIAHSECQFIKDIIGKSYQFELLMSEATAENFVYSFLRLFDGWNHIPKVRLSFGFVDLVLTRLVNDFNFMFCAFEIKASSPYNIKLRDTRRTQLAAYLISMAIENDSNLRIDQGKRFGCQELFGVLHIGLTPIFYKADITDKYIDSINSQEFDGIDELVIKEFVPVKPYTDREFTRASTRPLLLKSFYHLLGEQKKKWDEPKINSESR